MSKTITSGAVTFMDVTDNRRLDVYITSNLPNIQIKDVNTNNYTPNWTSTPLVLEADAYLDSQDVNSKTKFSWYKKGVDGIEVEIATNTKMIMVDTNELDNGQLIAYVCKALYKSSEADNGIQDIEQITFSQTITGLNGTDGTPAPTVQAQYSVDGVSNWTATLNAATHKYIRYSYDGGKTWTTAIKMVGEDGTSVNIKGTATSKSAVSGTSYYTLVYNSTTITGAAIGDAYLLDGNMYVCVDSRDGNDYFMDVGHIQGPQGNDGQSAYVFIRYATDANGTNMVASPTSTTTHIGICTVNTNVAPTTASSYTWSKFVGDSAKNIILSGTSQIFKVSSDATPIYTPTTIKVTAQVVNTAVATWEYSVNGGINWTTTIPAGASLDTSTNTLTITGKDLTSNALVVRASNGIYKDVYTVSKVFDGATGATASMAFLTNENISFAANASGQVALTSFTTNVVAYNGTTKVTPTIGTITGLPSGMTVATPVTVGNEQILTFSIANNSTLGSASSNNGTIIIPITSPVSTNLALSWSKINTGTAGVGISSTTVTYGVSDSSSTQPTEWQSTIPTVADGKYLWTRTVIDYTDPAKADTVTYTYAKQGTTGAQGNPGASVTVSLIQYQSGTSATTAPTGTWSSAVVSVADGNYLWTKTTFSDGKVAYGVAKQGASGRGVSNIAEYYLATTASSGVATSTTGWTTTIQTIDATKKYLWNYELITYTDNTTSTTTPVIIGVFGNTGNAGKGIKSVTEYYLATTLSSDVTTSTTGWTTTMQTLTDTNKYLWNYELITYTDNTTTTINPIIIGVYGDTGTPGRPGFDAVTFQVYSSNGYALSINTPTVTLQTFAYVGDVAITADATYQWYIYNDTGWTVLSGETNAYLTITREEVAFSKSYMCVMTFNGVEYTSIATIDDKNDENKVFTTKPSNYAAGDIWIVGVDYAPSGIEVGTLLRAEHTNTTYEDADWVSATKYDDKIKELQNDIATYNQYFSFDSTEGLKISAKDNNGTPSQFSTSLTNERLSFNYGNEAIAYINGTKMNIKEAEIESPLTVTGKYSGSTMLQAPVINIGNFSIIVESNGSLSIVANT